METLDLIIVLITLAISTAIGIYFGFFDKSETSEEYMLGNRQMKVIPIAISLIASQISPLTIMGVPAEVYFYGATFALYHVTIFAVVAIMNYLIIPVFCENNLTNCYDYIERRFDRRTMMFLKMLFFLQGYLYLPVVSYISSLALSLMSGYNVHMVNVILCFVCVLYTMIGGIKAVVWTDVAQNFVIFLPIVAIALIGISRVGSVGEVISRAGNIGILNLNTNIDLTSRNTMWNSLISGILIMTCYIGLNQASVQRIVSLPSLKDARKAMIIFVFGFIITNFTVDFLGVIIASYFHECDPLKAGYIKTPDNMVSYFVTKTSSNIRGMYGIYMACIVCASLSTISANLNSLSGALFKDYIKSMIPTQRNENFIIKIIVFLSGCFLIFGGLILESLKSTAVQLSYTVFNLAYTSFISTFMLGFLAPRMRAKPMFIANIIGFLIMLAIILNGQYQYISGQFEYRPLEKNVQGCSLNVTIVDHHKPYPNKFDLFKMSYHWYVVLGSIITWTIAEVLNVVLSKEEIEEVDPKLFAPWIREKIIEARRDCENEMEEIVPLK